MVYIVMGVSGSGKSTVGKLLAEKIELEFHDADDFHSETNKEKMGKMIPLTTDDRIPWLNKLSEAISIWNRSGGAVLACSALKESYRRILSRNGMEKVVFIFLAGDKKLIYDRMKDRIGHYFPPDLLDSQLESLEPPANGIEICIDNTPEGICADIIQKLAMIAE